MEKNLDFIKKRITVKITSTYTKTKTARTTFLSKEAAMMISPKLRKIGDDDLVCGSQKYMVWVAISEAQNFRRYCKASGLSEKYESNGRHKITLHMFRSFFFTKATRVHDENDANKMTGHDVYLMQYDRLSVDEKM